MNELVPGFGNKPSIPAEKPKRREISDVPNPFPVRIPVRIVPDIPSAPQRTPREPVPVGR